jgi:hypothetical protein
MGVFGSLRERFRRKTPLERTIERLGPDFERHVRPAYRGDPAGLRKFLETASEPKVFKEIVGLVKRFRIHPDAAMVIHAQIPDSTREGDKESQKTRVARIVSKLGGKTADDVDMAWNLDNFRIGEEHWDLFRRAMESGSNGVQAAEIVRRAKAWKR